MNSTPQATKRPLNMGAAIPVKDLTVTLKKIADSYKFHNVVIRGFVNGIFTALGATIGFAILIVLAANLYSGLQGLPIISDFMRATGLDAVVEFAINQSHTDVEVSDEVQPEQVQNNPTLNQ